MITMRKVLLCMLALLPLFFLSCKTNSTKRICHIEGTISPNLNGKKIFLVPARGIQDAAHVDSVVIKDGKFAFDKDTVGMYSIRVDYHYRDGLQELLVVTEPGNVKVIISSNSVSSGTPQNDSLQVWKDFMISQNMKFAQLKQSGANEVQIKEFQANFDKLNKAFAGRQKPGVFKDFLDGNF